MRVKVPPTRLRYESLSAYTDQTRFLEGEARNRAQSDICYGMTLALKGSSHGETEPKKATHMKAGHNKKPPTSLKIIPVASFVNSDKSLGNSAVEVGYT